MSEASSKAYPRGIPFKPPDELVEQEARLKRWTTMLIMVAVVAVGFIVGTGLFVVRSIKQMQDKMADNQLVQAGDKDKNPGKDDKGTTGNGSKANPKDVNPAVKTPADADTQRDRMLDALGKLTGVHLDQCYLNIGLLADCTESEVYTTEEAQKWLERVVAQMELVDQQLDRIGKVDLDADEKKGLERCRQVSSQLRIQARELKEYWKNSDKEHAARYHKAREEAWVGVSDVLGIPRDMEDDKPKPEPKPEPKPPEKPAEKDKDKSKDKPAEKDKEKSKEEDS